MKISLPLFLSVTLMAGAMLPGADAAISLPPIKRAVDSLGFFEAIPVSISGFSGEVATVLKDDLYFMGLTNAPADQARFLIVGSNNGRVEGRLIEKATKIERLAKAYSGGSLRGQAHAFADEIALNVTGQPGIAQTKLAFKVEQSIGQSEVYLSDYDGFGARAVTQDRSIIAAPTWASRSSLVYASYKLGPLHLYSHDLPTGARRAVSKYPGMNGSPAISPDGHRMAMILGKGGNVDLYVCNLDGTGLRQLTNTRESESSPCWSPDGQTICFSSRDRGSASLYTIPASGGTMRRISTPGFGSPTEPDWSPDGRLIAFTSMTARDFLICIVPADGKGGPTDLRVSGEDPSWAPNSRALVFSRGPDHAKKLYLLDVPTKRVKDIARIAASNSQPSWAKFK